MSGDVHVRFCESLGVKFPRATHPIDRKYRRVADLPGRRDRSCDSILWLILLTDPRFRNVLVALAGSPIGCEILKRRVGRQ